MDHEYLLKKVQNAELYLLLEFDKVCRQNNLTYFLDSGTALGAVRHGGFIPWDDDIDVGMPRKDYERFMEIGQSLLPNNIFLQNRDTELNYRRYAAKLRLEGTYFQETELPTYKHNGIYIDIFPFDYLPNNQLIAKLNVKFVVELLHIVRSKYAVDESRSKSFLHRIISRIIKKMPFSFIDRIDKYSLKCARERENKPSRLLTCYFWRMSQSKQYIFETYKILPVKDINFAGYQVKIVKEPDYYLKLMYGDYMKLPPIEQRKTHCKGDVDFGNY